MPPLLFLCLICLSGIGVFAEKLLIDDVPWKVSFISRVYDQVIGKTTFTYEVNVLNVGGKALAQWMVALPNCPEVEVLKATPGGAVSTVDTLSGINGLQWTTHVAAGKSRTFSVLVEGHIGEEVIQYVVSGTGNENADYGVGTINGPACSTIPDAACNAGGPYYAFCVQHTIMTSLTSSSQHVKSQEWSVTDPKLSLDNPTSINPLLTIDPTSLKYTMVSCEVDHKVFLTVQGEDGAAPCHANIHVNDTSPPDFLGLYAEDITVESDDVPAIPEVWAVDDCDSNVVVAAQETAVGDSPVSRLLIRTWSVTDFCHNNRLHTQTITIKDTTKPVLRGVEENAVAECDAVPPPCEVEAYDYNDVTVTMTESRYDIPGKNCENWYTLIRTWTAVDEAGNQASESQTITVQDTASPIISGTPEDETVECDKVPAHPDLLAMDSCGSNTLIFDEITKEGATDNDYQLIRTWTAADLCGNGAFHAQTVTVQDTQSPVLGGVDADSTILCYEVPPPCVVTVIDNCDTTVDVVYDQQTVQGSCEDHYDLVRTWTTTDVTGNSASESQALRIRDITPPKFTGLPPESLTVECSDIPQFVVTATDKCDPSITVSLVEQKSTTVYSENEYNLFRDWIAFDRCGNQAKHRQMLSVGDTIAPILEGVPHDIAVSCNSVPSLENSYVTVTDKCSCSDSNLLVVVSGQESYAGSCADEYTLVRTWHSEDCANNRVEQTQTITVRDNESPVMTGLPGDQQVQCDAIPDAVSVGVSDNCDEGITVVPSEVQSPGLCPYDYSLTRTWSSSDVCGNFVQHQQHIAVKDNSPPTFTNPDDGATHNFECAGDPHDSMNLGSFAYPAATDSCDENVDVSHVDTETIGHCINDVTVVREYTATDDCGNTASQVQTFHVVDTTAPSLISDFASATTVEFPATEFLSGAPVVEGVDACDGQVDITKTEISEDWPPCPGRSFKVVRTWRGTDLCGNVSPLLEQEVTVDDTELPLLIGGPDDVTVKCHEIPNPAVVTATDSGNGEVTVTLHETVSGQTCLHSHTLTRRWVAVDECGNEDFVEQVITVVDDAEPILYGVPDDATTECDLPAPATVTVSDECDADVIVGDPQEVQVPGVEPNVIWVVTRTWSATDKCENVVTASQVITIKDTLDPGFESVPDAITVECSDDLGEIPVLVPIDSCDATPSITTDVQEFPSTVCADFVVYHRKWIATDASGHSVTAEQQVFVKDTQGPTFTYVPDDKTISCSDTIVVPVIAVEDNCDPEIEDPELETSEIHVEGSPQHEYSKIFEFSAEDRCGNTATAKVTITITDHIPPTFDEFIDHQLPCEEDYTQLPAVTATDDCYDVTPTYVDSTVSQPCPHTYTVERTWTVIDGSGNQATTSQTFAVTDSAAPVIDVLPPSEIEVSYLDIPSYPSLTVSDNCASVTPVWENTTDSQTCDNGYRLKYTATITDDCGLSVEAVQYVNVKDAIAPAIVPQYEDREIECDQVDTLESMSTVSTDDSSATIISTDSITENADCTHSYIIRRVWVAADDCGNVATYTQTITVVDTHDPVLDDVPADTTVYCDYTAQHWISATDNCDGDVTDIKPVITSEDQIDAVNYKYIYTWTHQDPCQNTAISAMTVTVIDNIPPEISNVPVDVTTTFLEVPVANADTVVCTDNCNFVTASYETTSVEGTCINNYDLIRKWTCTDQAGLTESAEMTVTVEDHTNLDFNNRPADQTVEWIPGLPDAIPVESVESTVAGVDVVYTTANDANPDPATDHDFVITRTWFSEDECGNTVTHTQTITVVTPVPPVLPELPADIYISCEEIGIYLSGTKTKIDEFHETISENVPVDNVLSKIETFEQGSCVNEYNFIVQWTATDEAGQTISDDMTIFVVDHKPPQWVSVPASHTIASCEMPNAPAVDATDNCAQDLIPETPDTFGDSTGPVTVDFSVEPQGDDWHRTWTATDACGNSISTTQLVQISDTEKPVFSPGVPADEVIDCAETPVQTVLTADDNCDTVSVEPTSSGEFDPCSYVLTYTWTASDTSGNVVVAHQMVTITDTGSPTFSNDPLPPTVVTVECTDIPTAPTLIGDDDCGNAQVNYQENIEPHSCTPYDITREWTVTDDCGSSSTYTQVITVVDTVDPVLSGIPDDETRECKDLSPTPVVTIADDCDNIALVVPSEDTTAGTCTESSILLRTWTVTDCSGNIVNDLTQSQEVTYLDRTPPTLSGLTSDNRDITVTCPSAEPPVPTLTANDNCDPNPILAPSTITLSQVNSDNYVVERSWTVTDNCGNSVEDSQTLHFEDVDTPTITCALTQRVDCSDITDVSPIINFAIPPFAYDACSAVTVTGPTFVEKINENCQGEYENVYSWTVTDASGLVNSCEGTIQVYDDSAPYFEITPTDLEIQCGDTVPSPDIVSIVDACSSAFSYNLAVDTIPGDCSDEYSLERKWDAYDDCGHHKHHLQVITVIDNTPPVLVGVPSDETFTCEGVPQVNNHGVTAVDNCDDGVTVTFEVEVTSSECDDNHGTYEHTLTWSAVDRCGNDEEASMVVDVYDNTSPVLVNVPNHVTVDCADIPDAPTITAVDNCHPDQIAGYKVDREDGPSTWQYLEIRTWSVVDPCGNPTEQVQSVEVTDDHPPVFDFFPEDATYNCGEPFVIGNLNAQDNCLDPATVEKSEPERVLGTCLSDYKLVTTWTAWDVAGNSATWSQTLSFEDFIVPVLVNTPGNEAVECDQIPEPTPLQVTDVCSDDIDAASPTDIKENIVNENEYSLLRTWVAVDACGNQASHTQTIFVTDTTKPKFSLSEVDDVDVSCDDVPAPSTITGTDNCVENIVVAFKEETQTGDCPYEYVLYRTWSASDASGNEMVVNQEVTVDDSHPPVLQHTPAHETLSCAQAHPVPDVQAHDSCSGAVTVSLAEETVPSGGTPNNYLIIRTWTAVDDCGLSAEWVQTVTVNDIVSPDIQGNPDSTVEIGNVPVPGSASVQDNCDTTIPPEVPCVESKEESGTCLYNYTLKYLCVVTDSAGNYAEHRYTVQVHDTTPPIFYFDETVGAGVAPPDTTYEYGEQPSHDDSLMGVVAVDNSEHEIIIALPEVTIIIPDENNDHEFSLIWTYRACDDCGNCAEIDRTITVTDTTPPCLSEEPPSEEVDCDNIPPPCEVTTVGENLVVTTTHSDIFEEDGKKYITRTWSACDLSSNCASHTQTLTIVDHSPPVFSRYPESETVSCSCDSFPLAPEVNVIDNCDFATVQFSEDKILGISDDSYALERIWSASDESGNEVRHKQVITVEDKEAPVLSKKPTDSFVECDNIPDPASVYIKDNCDPEISVNYEFSTVPGDCLDAYQIQRFWAGTDRSGNSVNHRQVINVRDSQAPVFDVEDSVCILPNQQYIEFSTTNMFTATDNCDTVSYGTSLHIYQCNSTNTAAGAEKFDVTCHFDEARSIMSIFANVDVDETDGRTYYVYAEATDRCGNTAIQKREFWIPFTEEDAAMEGLVCETADKDDLVDNPY